MATQTIRVAAPQTANRTIPFSAVGGGAALARVEANLEARVGLAQRAADEGCRIAAQTLRPAGPSRPSANACAGEDISSQPVPEDIQSRATPKSPRTPVLAGAGGPQIPQGPQSPATPRCRAGGGGAARGGEREEAGGRGSVVFP